MRSYQILNDLKEKQDYCSLDYLNARFDVSKRTIQNDLAYLMSVSSHHGFQIHNKRGAGYILEIVDHEAFEKYLNSLNNGVLINSKQRPSYILAYLATRNNFVTMEQIAEMFQVSKTLVKNDMPLVDKEAKEKGFEVIKRSHYGVRLKSDEMGLKDYLCEKYAQGNEIVKTEVDNLVNDYEFVEKQLIAQLNNMELNINYYELVHVTNYLRIMIYFAHLKHEEEEAFTYESQDALTRISQYILSIVKRKYQCGFSMNSIQSFVDLLHEKVRIDHENTIPKEHLKDDVENFIKKTDEVYNTSFQSDEDFKKLLIIHVSFLLDRLHKKVSYKNPLANELSITHPMIFNIAIQFCDMLSEKYNVKATFDEIGFITLHFVAHMEKERQQKLQAYERIGVVCSSGGGSSYLIKMQIESLFQNGTVETFSFLQEEELIAFQPDLIFTVIPLSEEIKTPVIYIKELLDDKDLYRIKQMLQCDEYDPYSVVCDEPMYMALLNKDVFHICEGNDYEHEIAAMADELVAKGYAKDDFKKLVLERESYVSTVYMNGVCIPHPLATDAYKSVISVRIFKEPFQHDGKDVRIIFMICLKKEQVELYKVITKQLYRLMNDCKYLEKFVNVKTFEEMMVTISDMGGVDK